MLLWPSTVQGKTEAPPIYPKTTPINQTWRPCDIAQNKSSYAHVPLNYVHCSHTHTPRLLTLLNTISPFLLNTTPPFLNHAYMPLHYNNRPGKPSHFVCLQNTASVLTDHRDTSSTVYPLTLTFQHLFLTTPIDHDTRPSYRDRSYIYIYLPVDTLVNR